MAAMDRRTLIISGLASLGAAEAARATPTDAPPPAGAPPSTEALPVPSPRPNYPVAGPIDTYSRDETVNKVSDFLGVSAEGAAGAVEHAFKQQGKPTAYIAGEEGSGAFVFGLRYGRGLLYMKDMTPMEVFWQGPSLGFDWGANASRVFTLCYNLQFPEVIYQRFGGVEGTAYFIGGIGMNYQTADDVTLAPMRVGVGARLGANMGYLAYSRERRVLPF
jgi:hypothetical protein